MILRTIIAAVCIAVPAHAQSVKLQEHEIEILLSGNTAVGLWDGTPYRQYFDPDGTTIYAQDDVRSTTGRWRVQGEEYQSVWPPNDTWDGWFVMEYNGDFYWVSKSTPPTPFQMLQGQHLTAE